MALLARLALTLLVGRCAQYLHPGGPVEILLSEYLISVPHFTHRHTHVAFESFGYGSTGVSSALQARFPASLGVIIAFRYCALLPHVAHPGFRRFSKTVSFTRVGFEQRSQRTFQLVSTRPGYVSNGVSL
jgi:hypothetical protein